MALRDWFGALGAMFGGSGPKDSQRTQQQATAYITKSGIIVGEDAALEFPAVLGAIRNISEDVAATPLHVFARNSAGRTKAFWHPLYKLLHDRPNECMAPIDFWGSMLYGAMMHGCGYAYIERGYVIGADGITRELLPIGLWPLRSDRMIVHIENGKLQYAYVDEFTGEATTFAAPDILPLRGFSREGLYGLGMLRFGSEAIGAGLAGQTFAASYFGNGTTFGGVLQIPQGLNLSEKARENLLKSFVENRGPDRAFKARLLEDGITWQPGGANPADAQMVEQQTWSVQQICRLTRERPTELGDMSNATYSNIESENISRLTKTLRPWLIRVQQACNSFLMSADDAAKGYYVEHTVEALMLGDTKATYEAIGIALDKGWMNRDEARERLNLNRIPGGSGQAFLVQSAQTTLDLVVAGANVGAPSDPLMEAIAEGEDVEPVEREDEEPAGLDDEDGEEHYTPTE